MAERLAAEWGQLHLSRVSDGTALYALLNKIGIISSDAQFHFSSTFATSIIRTLRFFSRAIHNVPGRPGGITLRHRFCAGAWMKMVQRVIDGLFAEFAARERLSLPDEHIMAAIHCLDWTTKFTLHLDLIVSGVLGCQCTIHSLPTSYCMIEIDPFSEELTGWIH